MKGHTIHVKKMHLPRGMNRTKGGSRFDTVAAVVHWPHSPGGRGLTLQALYQFWATDPGWGATQHAVDISGDIGEFLPRDRTAFHVGSDRNWQTGESGAPASMAYTPFAHEYFGREYTQHQIGRTPNYRAIGAEVSESRPDGYIDAVTWDAAVWLFAWYCQHYRLDAHRQILTHNHIVGWKDCPRWFVRHPCELERFRDNVADRTSRYRVSMKYT